MCEGVEDGGCDTNAFELFVDVDLFVCACEFLDVLLCCVAGDVVDGRRIAAGLELGQCGQVPRTLRIKMISEEVRVL